MTSIHPSVRIHPTAAVDPRATIGAGGVVGARCRIEGPNVVIGRELWMDEGAVIGGGSCQDPCSYLRAGDFLHLGMHAQVNTARGVALGDEVGLGIETKVFTHGAYLSELDGFPVQFAPVRIGSRVWLPNAWVNPGVEIGDDVVVAARSLVNRDLPSGCLAGGIPVRVLKEGAYPRALDDGERFNALQRIVNEAGVIGARAAVFYASPRETALSEVAGIATEAGAQFYVIGRRRAVGRASKQSEIVRNQLRRHGIRFRVSVVDGEYVPWE